MSGLKKSSWNVCKDYMDKPVGWQHMFETTTYLGIWINSPIVLLLSDFR